MVHHYDTNPTFELKTMLKKQQQHNLALYDEERGNGLLLSSLLVLYLKS